MKTHDPAKAEVLGFFFDAINELEHSQGWNDENKERIRETVNEIMMGRVYGGGCSTVTNDDLRHFYESDYWQATQHMTIADYAPDAKALYEWEQIETRYYQELRRAVFEAKAEEVLNEIGKQLEAFYDYLSELGHDFWGSSDYRETFEAGYTELFALSSECPHGWQRHTDEKQEGKLYVLRWMNGQVDGLNAISLSMFGGAIWASLTIDPKDHRGLTWDM